MSGHPAVTFPYSTRHRESSQCETAVTVGIGALAGRACYSTTGLAGSMRPVASRLGGAERPRDGRQPAHPNARGPLPARGCPERDERARGPNELRPLRMDAVKSSPAGLGPPGHLEAARLSAATHSLPEKPPVHWISIAMIRRCTGPRQPGRRSYSALPSSPRTGASRRLGK